MYRLVVLLLLGLVAYGEAASLQYDSTTRIVTGFRVNRDIPAVAGYTVVSGLPDTFLSTVTLPAGCTFALRERLSMLTVTNETPGNFQVALNTTPICFQGEPVASKRELAVAAIRTLTGLFDDPALLYAYTLRLCPAETVTARCNALRAIVYRNDPDFTTVTNIAIEAFQLRNSVP